MRITPSLLIVCLLLAAPAAAQNFPALSVSISPNPAPPGASITITANDPSNGGLFTPLGCLVAGIRQGSPTGTNVAFFPCTFLGQPIPPCGQTPRMQVWNQSVLGGGTATPGDYWVEIQSSVGPFGAITSHHFPLTILGSNPEPVLTEVAPPQAGNYWFLDVTSDPSYGGDVYITALSETCDVGLALGGEHVGLDFGPLWQLTVPFPDPILFVNFQGALDGLGGANSIGVYVPQLPAGVCIPIHAQVFIARAGGGYELTNVVHTTFGG